MSQASLGKNLCPHTVYISFCIELGNKQDKTSKIYDVLDSVEKNTVWKRDREC